MSKLKFSPVVESSEAGMGSGFKAFRLGEDSFEGLADPILNIDHFYMRRATFPPHPHAGFSAVTYMLPDSENSFINLDSIGSEEEIRPGDLHWTVAASGIVHEETPKTDGIVCHGLQIFINLPEKLRKDSPKVYHLRNEDAPRKILASGKVEAKVLTGSFENLRSPIQLATPVDFLDFAVLGNSEIEITLKNGQNLFVLALGENLSLNLNQPTLDLKNRNAVAMANESSDEQKLPIFIEGKGNIILLRSRPLKEAFVFKGPFVAKDLASANMTYQRYKNGEFGSLDGRGVYE